MNFIYMAHKEVSRCFTKQSISITNHNTSKTVKRKKNAIILISVTCELPENEEGVCQTGSYKTEIGGILLLQVGYGKLLSKPHLLSLLN